MATIYVETEINRPPAEVWDVIGDWEHGPVRMAPGFVVSSVLDGEDRLVTFANGVTKRMLHQEWSMSVDEAIEAEAQAQAICMATNDFHRAYHAFVAKQRPVFEGD